ncbi:MAG: DUF4422 domain-containing protein [Lachnospiraceae bacterium]|nr:DUF4422 domain-containing protein [Lachnospiraceae bacterium]
MNQKIYIFGAHSRARTLATYLQYLYPDVIVEAYLYDNEEPNPCIIDGIEVHLVSQSSCNGLHREYPVFLGTRGVFHERLTEKLRGMGFGQIYPVTVEMDRKLRGAYLESYFKSAGREFRKIESLILRDGGVPKKPAAVYVVKSALDRPLQQEYTPLPWEKEIQAGACLAEEKICGIADDTGENISKWNRQFCELTALYWIWKNAEEDILGLSHYRRHFILPEDWKERMEANGVDVLLPVPLYVAPSLEENYRERHDQAAWDCMMQCLKEKNEGSFREAEAFFKGNLYSPCNMFIMRKGVLDELCEWLFPLLFRTVEQVGEKPDCYQNRYPGFLSERLMTFFFERNREKYRVAYADKNFLQ